MMETTITSASERNRQRRRALKAGLRHSTPRAGSITQAYRSGDSDALLQALKLKTVWVDSCWLWTGRLGSDGKPLLDLDGRQVRAQRVLLECVLGNISADLSVKIKCGVRNCMNPEHLVLFSIS